MKYEPGTRLSNSEWYDAATDEVTPLGDTVFMQYSPDGKPTGRRAVVIGGILMDESVAEKAHKRNAEAVAVEMVDALQAILFQVAQGKVLERDACIAQARAVYAKARR